MKKLVFVAAGALILGFSTGVHAILTDNGEGAIYDTALDVTWYDHTYQGPLHADTSRDQANGWTEGLDWGGEKGYVNTDQYTTLPPEIYRSDKEYGPDQDRLWHFGFGDGNQGHFDFHDGNRGHFPYGGYFYGERERHRHFGAPVPIPGAVLLLASGLAGIAITRRRFGR